MKMNELMNKTTSSEFYHLQSSQTLNMGAGTGVILHWLVLYYFLIFFLPLLFCYSKYISHETQTF